MPAPTNIDELLKLVRKSGLVEEKRLDGYLQKLTDAGAPATDASKFAGLLVRDGVLTQFQVEQLLLGKWRRFHIGKYKVLERIGSGGMGSVYLCEHRLMRRRVAVKVLPTSKADDSSAKERFLREARAVAALDHPNIVRAYDIDQDDNLHFLVMEYVDGCNLQEIVKRSGPLDIYRCAHYMAQAALALEHAYKVAGIVHRDIKPGNILVDRNGVVKVLDMGLARFFHDEEDLLTQKYDENVLGTADYLAPEQALDSHSVDIRADIYSLGATLYFCLTGRAPFSEGTVAQKLIWHQTRQPKPIQTQRPEVPVELCAVVEKLMAKDPGQRYQTPIDVAAALSPWTQSPIAPPAETELPKLSPAAMGGNIAEPSSAPVNPTQATGPGSRVRKNWQVPSSPPPQPQQQKSPAPPPSTQQGAPVPEVPTKAVLPSARDVAVAAPAPRTVAPALDPEPVSWEALAADTQEVLDKSDTVPHKARPRHASASTIRKERQTFLAGLPQQYLWWGAAGAALLGLLVFLLIRTFTGGERKREGQPGTGAAAQFLRVERSAQGQAGTFATLRDALTRARNSDRIKVFDEVIEEQLALADPRLARDVTIESGLEGKRFVWRPPAQLKDGEPLLKVNNVEGLHVRDFIMDGQGRLKDLVTLSGPCPGLTLEEGQLQGFTGRGITLVNCEGRSDKEVRLSRLRILRSNPRESGIFFDALPRVREGVNQYVQVHECSVEGGGSNGAVQMTSPEVLRHVAFVKSPKPEKVIPVKPAPKK